MARHCGQAARGGQRAKTARISAATEVQFAPLRWWRSPLGGTRYPVQWRVDTPAGAFAVQALLDNQELDSRGSTGAIYWEGCARCTQRAQARMQARWWARATWR